MGLPSWLLLLLVVLPWIVGARTLFYRDVLSTHYPLKAAQAQLAEEGWPAPLIDPYRGGGQPLLGNPNAVPFYPSNLFYRFADPLWSLCAHFWLHWLLAPLAGFWLARSWLLDRPGAWACGVVWATGAYVMSLLNLYNMAALATLAPATVAAFVSLARPQRSRWGARVPAAAALAGLTFLGGDPASASLVYLLAAAAVVTVLAGRQKQGTPAVRREAIEALRRIGLATSLASMLAAPVLLEMLRVLPTSYRGLWRYQAESVLAQSWHPVTFLDWWFPGFFGRLDLSFWGGGVFGGNPPLFSSLFPGWIAVALVVTAGLRHRGRDLWAWCAILGGIFLALGSHNPVLARSAEWFDLGILRYPMKAWLAVALGLSLLAGLGFQRLWSGARRTVFVATLLVLAVSTAAARPLIDASSALARFATATSGGRLAGSLLDAEVARWAGIWASSFLVLGMAIVVAVVARRRRGALALLLVLQTASQLFLLRDLLAADETFAYRAESSLASMLGEVGTSDVVHGDFAGQFGPSVGRRDPSLTLLSRSLFAELFHGAGIPSGLRYPFTRSPEGLDSFYAVAFAKALPGLSDVGRLRLLEVAGVEYLLLGRTLATDAAARVQLTARVPSPRGPPLHVYRLLHAADEVSLVHGVRRAPSMTDARSALLDPSFQPRQEVLLPGEEPAAAPAGAIGKVNVYRNEPERVAASTDSDTDSYLVIQRAWLPIWRATIDGAPVELEIANGWQMAVPVPAGRHDVEIFVDSGPGRWALAVFFSALAIIGWLLWPGPARHQASGV